MLATRISLDSGGKVVDKRLSNAEIVTKLEFEYFVWQLYIKLKVSASLEPLPYFVGYYVFEKIIVANGLL